MIYCNTSSFNCNDVVGKFYPLGTPEKEWLTNIFVNNYWRGQVAGTIRQLRTMLD